MLVRLSVGAAQLLCLLSAIPLNYHALNWKHRSIDSNLVHAYQLYTISIGLVRVSFLREIVEAAILIVQGEQD